MCHESVGLALKYRHAALLLQVIEGKTKTVFIMDDPAGNSYLQVRWCAVRLEVF